MRKLTFPDNAGVLQFKIVRVFCKVRALSSRLRKLKYFYKVREKLGTWSVYFGKL